MRNNYSFLICCNNYSLVGTIISKINVFPNKQFFHIYVTIIKIKIIKNNLSLSQIYEILILRKYNCMSKIFPKINLKFYSNVITYNQTYEYV